jgi:glycosyltransferase involved in cell wall biosynthesis
MDRPYWPFDDMPRGAIQRLMWHAKDDLGAQSTAKAIMQEVQPDVVHTHNIGGLSTGIWRAAASLGIPIVHTIHDYYLLCPRTSRFRNGGICGSTCGDCRMLTMRRRHDSNLVGDIVGVSGAVLAEHTKQGLFANARQHVVHNIIEQDMAADPVMPQSPVTFGFLGRVTVEKGAERLVTAYAAMKRPARLVIGGRADPALQERLRELAGEKPIEFPGFVKPTDFFRQIDVLVVPSIWQDPFPTVILEAQMAGKPTIGSRCGGIPEAIGGEAAGWTYDADAPRALTSLLDTVAAVPQAIMAKATGAKAASERFRVDLITDNYLDVYGKALMGNSRSQ